MAFEVVTQSLIERANTAYDSWEAGLLFYEEALQELDLVIAEATEQNLPDAMLAGLNNIVILLRDAGMLELSLQVNMQGFELAQREGNSRYLSYAAFNRGDIFRIQGKNELARQAFREAYKFADEAADYLAAAYALHSEGKIVMALQQTDLALMMGEKGLAYIQLYLETSKQPDLIYTSLQSSLNQLLARVAMANGDSEATWQRAQQALDLAHVRNSSLELGNTYCVLAELATQYEVFPDGFNNDYDTYYQTALIYYERAHAAFEMAAARLKYAQSLHEHGRTDEAIPLVEEASKSYKKLQRGAEFLYANKLLITYRKVV